MTAQGPARKVRVSVGLVGLSVFLLILAEIAALVWVAGEIGWWTLAILGVTTVVGLFLLQREWRKAWGGLAEAMRSGEMPAGALADATLVLIGGILLVLPGFLTDIVGLLLLLPFTRPFIRSGIAWWAAAAVNRTGRGTEGAGGVIKGDVVDEPQTGTLIPEIQPSPEEGQ